jgi:hypothetical protein
MCRECGLSPAKSSVPSIPFQSECLTRESPQNAGATRIELPRRTRSDGARQLIFLCSGSAAYHGSYHADLPSSVGLFSRSFSWALLRANSCARQLRVFCFPGSSQRWFKSQFLVSLPKSSRSLWEQYPLASVCPRKWGRKRRHFHVLLIC